MQSSLRKNVLAALVVVAASAVCATTVSAGNVTETKPECSNATALLLGGDGADGESKVSRIRSFLESKKIWTIGSAKSGQSGEVGLVEYQVASPSKGGPAAVYGVECGSGVDCNTIAHAFSEKNADSTPVVFCGEAVILTNKSAR